MRLAPQETRTYLVTAVTAGRRGLFQVTATAELLERTILDYHTQGKFLLHAFVIMPDHFHALITPAPDVSLEKAMQFIKGGFSFRLKSKLDVLDAQLQREPDFNGGEVRELCAVYRREPGAAGDCDDAGSLSFQFRCSWTAGWHAFSLADKQGPGLRPPQERLYSGA